MVFLYRIIFQKRKISFVLRHQTLKKSVAIQRFYP